MKQTYVITKDTRKNTQPIVEKDRREKNTYWIQSFNPKHQQKYYKIVFSLEDNVVDCSCPAWKYKMGGGVMCKHMLRLLEVLP
ncbi:MAG: SWIM zinc finger family protein [Nitrososphaeraceae archaeon]